MHPSEKHNVLADRFIREVVHAGREMSMSPADISVLAVSLSAGLFAYVVSRSGPRDGGPRLTNDELINAYTTDIRERFFKLMEEL